MMSTEDAMILEDRIGLRVLIGKRIDCDAVVVKELFDFL